MNDSLKLDMFFPGELLSITSVDHDDSSIYIKMRSKTHSSKCPECGQETKTYHGTYLRKVQDLPILEKTARLHITAHEHTINLSDNDIQLSFDSEYIFRRMMYA